MQLFQAPPLALLGLGSGEIIWVFVILLFLFGSTKLPGLARGLGLSVKEFKKAQREDDEPAKPAEAKKPAESGKPGSN